MPLQPRLLPFYPRSAPNIVSISESYAYIQFSAIFSNSIYLISILTFSIFIEINYNIYKITFCSVKICQKREALLKASLKMFAMRFERTTFRLGGGRSIQLSYANMTFVY